MVTVHILLLSYSYLPFLLTADAHDYRIRTYLKSFVYGKAHCEHIACLYSKLAEGTHNISTIYFNIS